MRHTLTVVAYDIPSDGRRTRLHALLKQYGRPVQKSVFEARLTHREREQMLARARRLLKPEQDHLVVYVVPPSQERNIASIGGHRPDTRVDPFFVV